MRLVLLIFVSLLLGAPGRSAPPPTVRSLQTFDQARQLLVQGGTFAQRTAVLRLASDLRQTVLDALSLPQDRYPVARPLFFVLRPELPPDSLPRFEVVEDPGGLKLQIQIAPLEPEPRIGVERTVLVLLLTELALRQTPLVKASERAPIPYPPRWLVDALLYRHHHQNSVFSPPSLRSALDSGKIPVLASLLGRPESDWAVSTDEEIDLARTLFWMLSNRSDFREGLGKLLTADFSQRPQTVLQRCFPSLGTTDAALQREWTLAVAAYGTQQEIVALDGPQTELQIRRLARLDLYEPATGRHFSAGLEQFSDYLRLPGISGVLSARQLEWIALRERCHFLYSEVTATYAQVCGLLAQGKMDGVAERLRAATLERESIAARLERIHDHLNWFEAVAAPRTNSRRLKEFYRLLNAETQVSPAVSAALDRAEKKLRTEAEREDIGRILDEARQRKNPPK